jgi:hypothetical protein
MLGSTVEEDVLVFDSPDDRHLIQVEAAADPAFAKKISAMLSRPDGEKQVVMYARKAIVNELNPSAYPETRGQWPKLREAVSRLSTEIPKAIVDHVDSLPLEDRVKALESISSRVESLTASLGELGQLDIIASLIGTVVNAGVSVYNAQVISSTQKKIANQQLQANELEIQQSQDIANAQAAVAKAKAAQAVQATLPAPAATAVQNVIEALPTSLQAPVAGLVSLLSTDVGGGIPAWLVGVVIYMSSGK